MPDFLSSRPWLEARERALARDGHRCTLGWILGDDCVDDLDVHHLIPRAERPDLAFDGDNLVTACDRHHPQLEALRRHLLRKREAPRCRHAHPYRQGREECEARLARL